MPGPSYPSCFVPVLTHLANTAQHSVPRACSLVMFSFLSLSSANSWGHPGQPGGGLSGFFF